MRLAEIELIKYGHFDSRHMEFPSGHFDLQIISGAKEAGKSTAMAAINNLLFGFPKTMNHDFRFYSKLLRIGAILETKEGALACRRRKGAKAT